MRFLLINVPVRVGQKPSSFPIGAGIIAQVLLDNGHQVEVIDANAFRYSPEEVVSRAAASDAAAIGISGLVSTYRYQVQLIKQLKERMPDRPIIAGGGCASSIPHLMMKHTPVDLLAIGEGEHTIIELVAALEQEEPLEQVRGIWIRQGDTWIATPPRPLERDLDQFPLPAYQLFPTERYLKHPVWKVETPAITLISSRGCPMSCNFCYNVFGKRSYRVRGAASIHEEVRLLRDRYGIKFFCFVDDNLTINREHLASVCSIFEQEKIAWGCHGRVDCADNERLKRMASAGCKFLGFGIESGSQRILDKMNKRATVKQARQAIYNTVSHGITANTTYIYGYPGEDEQSIRETMRFKIDFGQTAIGFFATPYPGTQLYQWARDKGLIPDEHAFVLALNDASDFLINLTQMSDNRLAQLGQQSREELKIAATYRPIAFSKAELSPQQELDCIRTIPKLLEHDFLLPDIRGYLLLCLARLFIKRGEVESAAKVAQHAKTLLA